MSNYYDIKLFLYRKEGEARFSYVDPLNIRRPIIHSKVSDLLLPPNFTKLMASMTVMMKRNKLLASLDSHDIRKNLHMFRLAAEMEGLGEFGGIFYIMYAQFCHFLGTQLEEAVKLLDEVTFFFRIGRFFCPYAN